MTDRNPATFKVGNMTLRERPNGDGLQVLGEDGLWYDMRQSFDSARIEPTDPTWMHCDCEHCKGRREFARERQRPTYDRDLCIALLACLGEMKGVIQSQAGTRYSGASIDAAYEATWREFAKRVPLEELALQERAGMHPRHIQEWLRSART